MKVYTDLQAFNECYKPGDSLLMADAFGQTFTDRLAAPAIVLGEQVFIRLEECRCHVNIYWVVSTADNLLVSDTSQVGKSLRQFLIQLVSNRVKRLKGRIQSHQDATEKLTQRKKLTEHTLVSNQPTQDVLINRNELQISQIQVQYELAVKRLNQLLSEIGTK